MASPGNVSQSATADAPPLDTPSSRGETIRPPDASAFRHPSQASAGDASQSAPTVASLLQLPTVVEARMRPNATSTGDESSASASASTSATPQYSGQNGAGPQLRQRSIAPRIRGVIPLGNSRRERVFCFCDWQGFSKRAWRKSPVTSRSRIGRRADIESQATGKRRLELATSPNVLRATPRLMGKETRPSVFNGNRAIFRGVRRRSQGAGVVGRRFPICNDRCVPPHYRQQSRRPTKALRRIRGWR